MSMFGFDIFAAWRNAEAEAVVAYEHWRRTRSGDDHAVYRASAARADAAQDALAATARRLRV